VTLCKCQITNTNSDDIICCYYLNIAITQVEQVVSVLFVRSIEWNCGWTGKVHERPHWRNNTQTIDRQKYYYIL